MVNNIFKSIFKKGSKTFYTSSFFLPENTQKEVSILYSFVRVADNFVDDISQDKKGFLNFKNEYFRVHNGGKSNNQIINSYCKLEKERGFDPIWTVRFLESMESDLEGTTYNTIGDTKKYMYGSASVIGLYLSKIMELPKEYYPYGELLGQCLQYINFIRDIDEDNGLKRSYLPKKDLEKFNLKDLSFEEANKKREQFVSFMRFQIDRYEAWQKKAEEGFYLVPNKYLVFIKTISDMYKWTGQVIKKDPFIVYKKKVKPSKARINYTGIKNMFSIYFKIR